MDIERFHNELAMRLGYERIVKDKRILISVEESQEPIVTLRIEGSVNTSFKASEKLDYMGLETSAEMLNEVKRISDAVHEAYLKSASETFAFYNNGIR